MRTFCEPFDLPPDCETLRAQVRAFLAETIPHRTARERAESWMGLDPEFSAKMGARGWIGMTWPKKYGGHERSFAERYVVIEEMLAAGAPVSFHWIADRQSGPLLLRFGTEEQRQSILPRIARGELGICIGMSEPGAGSDLAGVRTRGRRIDGGWQVNGQKIWTTNAHNATYMIALVRTQDGERHAGLSQLLIDLKSPGITIKQIENLAGEKHFNEVFFDDVFVPDGMLIGQDGDGWRQVGAELAFERSGPERYLSSLQLLLEFLRLVGPEPTEAERLFIGEVTARMWTLRQMSLAITGKIIAGGDPAADAAIVKDLGVTLEQDLPPMIQALAPWGKGDKPFNATLHYLLMSAPSFSLRGGTREILRGIIARELGPAMSELRALLADTTEKVLANLPDDEDAAQKLIDESGLANVMVPESEGGFGGGWEDALIVLRAAGYHAIPNQLAHAVARPKFEGVSAARQHLVMALVRSCQMAGAMQAALDLSVQYVRERQQFGKPLASFQAIQQQLALFAQETAATSMAAAAACRAADRGTARFEIACAKLRADMAVTTATSVAHQVHGAMGFTKEYKLQRRTKLLWQWRGDYGNDRYWADMLGGAMAAKGPAGFWPALVSPATIGIKGASD